MVVSPDDVERVRIPAPVVRIGQRPGAIDGSPPAKTKLSALAIVAFAFSLLGLVLMGVPGLIGIVLGAIAIGGINARRDRHGAPFAAAAIIIGIVAIIGWAAFVGYYFINIKGDIMNPAPRPAIATRRGQKLANEDLEDVSEPIRRAVRANVLVSARGSLQEAQGSGVVIERRGDDVLVITNRHVIEGGGSSPRVDVTFWNGKRVDAAVKWFGPMGVDAAVLSCSAAGQTLDVARVRVKPKLIISEDVFAIGNPLGLGWSYAKGVVSAFRKQDSPGVSLKLIQTTVPLNPGNSGGGLYDKAGSLVGINTLTADKRAIEGINFALAISDLIGYIEEQAGVKLIKADGEPNPGETQQR